jgi:hypothetical protein
MWSLEIVSDIGSNDGIELLGCYVGIFIFDDKR